MNSAVGKKIHNGPIKSNPLVKLETSAKKLEWNSSSFHFGDRRMSITQKPVVKAWPSVFYVGTTTCTYLESGNGVSRNLGLGCY